MTPGGETRMLVCESPVHPVDGSSARMMDNTFSEAELLLLDELKHWKARETAQTLWQRVCADVL